MIDYSCGRCGMKGSCHSLDNVRCPDTAECFVESLTRSEIVKQTYAEGYRAGVEAAAKTIEPDLEGGFNRASWARRRLKLIHALAPTAMEQVAPGIFQSKNVKSIFDKKPGR